MYSRFGAEESRVKAHDFFTSGMSHWTL
uniref:Uncharacterized protein n=1 Tax=Anguilla anguilla TaxID=7936 RepID=A0A0E9VWQ5_ANGAN